MERASSSVSATAPASPDWPPDAGAEFAAWDWWTKECNRTFAECKNDCDANSF